MNNNAAVSVAPVFGEAERVHFHLQNWGAWMRSGNGPALPKGSTGLTSGGASQHFDDMADASDRRVARVVDTLVMELPMGQRLAINHAYLSAVFEFRRGNYQDLLALAKVAIGRGLAKRGIW